MSEYWKSIPKYYCKFCKTYVRDTPFERQQHEATGRHQGSIQRSLRDINRGQEREAREKQRAKNEVARLNGVVAERGNHDAPGRRRAAVVPPTAPKHATPEERKRQLVQLAEMGVAIPDEFRGEMAMAGEWRTVSETPVLLNGKREEGDEKGGVGSVGVRKRKAEEGEDEGEEGRVRRRWGSTYKTQPVTDGDDNLEALFGGVESLAGRADADAAEGVAVLPAIKKEESFDGKVVPATGHTEDAGNCPVADSGQIDSKAATTDQQPPAAGIVFKKRKTKNIRPT